MFTFSMLMRVTQRVTKQENYLEILWGAWGCSGVLAVYPTHQIFLPHAMRASILHPFSHVEQQYLMYLNYCKGRFRVVVVVHINKTGSIFRCRIVLPTVLQFFSVALVYFSHHYLHLHNI